MQAHSKCLITDYLLTIELRTVYDSQSGISIKLFRVRTHKYRSNSNDGRSEAYLYFSVSYLRYKNPRKRWRMHKKNMAGDELSMM